ncbi:MAG: succinate--CoA ligase subunit alpha, partial [Acidimicrobiales bacterium]
MSIFVDENTKVIYQGLTGSQGKYYGLLNREYGTKVVAGTNPKKAGTDVDGIPIFASVADAVKATGATASCVFIPAAGVKSAVMEAAEGGVTFIVVITEGVPAHDEAWFYNKLKRDFPHVRLLGPNCPGIISPGKCNIGITAGHIAKAGGPVGIVSRSGTLTYQALYELKQKGIGVTTCVGIGGDPVPGTSFIDCLEAFQADPETKAVMMIGEIGGSAEEEAAEFIRTKMDKPVVSYIAGVTAPAGKKMGHAGAIVHQRVATAPTHSRVAPVPGVSEAATDRLPERGMDPGAVLLGLLGSANLSSRASVFTQYDSTVGADTVAGPGRGAAVLRVKGTTKGLVATTDGNQSVGAFDPWLGAALSVAEATRNVSITGARPLGVTNCLNYGDPSRPEAFWQLTEGVRGLADA